MRTATTIDGPCEDEPDQSCNDPADVDEDGHGTHVASTIAAPINGLGIAGVAPQATIVNLRAGQDSGYFFLQPSVDALTYAGRHGIDVVNMSYYVDPWLFNCSSHPADSPGTRPEQRTIVTAMQRALDDAQRHGVTLVSAAGNGATDYTKVISDASQPRLRQRPGRGPQGAYLLDPASCISMPSEGKHVISREQHRHRRCARRTTRTTATATSTSPRRAVTPTTQPTTVATSTKAEVLAAYPTCAGHRERRDRRQRRSDRSLRGQEL